MILEFWRREIVKTESNNFVVRELYINKGRYGGNVITKDVFTSDTKTQCEDYIKMIDARKNNDGFVDELDQHLFNKRLYELDPDLWSHCSKGAE